MDTVQIKKKSKFTKFIRAVDVQLGCLSLSSRQRKSMVVL